MPSFLKYPSHNINVVAKHILYIVKYGKTQKYGFNKADDLLLKKDWGYIIKKNRIIFRKIARGK